MSQETLQQAFPDKSTPIVSYSIPFPEACAKHVVEDFKASKVYLILWGVEEARERFEKEGLKEESAGVDQLLDVVVRDLGLKRKLSEVGVTWKEDFERLAEASLQDPWLLRNPVPVKTMEQALEILSMCA